MFDFEEMLKKETIYTIKMLENGNIDIDTWNRFLLFFRSLLRERYINIDYIYLAQLLIREANRLGIKDIYLDWIADRILKAKETDKRFGDNNMIFVSLVRDLDKDYIVLKVRKKGYNK